MTETPAKPKKTLKDRAEELLQGLLDALGGLLPSPPETLVPVPVRERRR